MFVDERLNDNYTIIAKYKLPKITDNYYQLIKSVIIQHNPHKLPQTSEHFIISTDR